MHEGIHQLHKRKRIHQKLEKYPHPNPWVKFLDNLLLVIAVIGPFSNLPQIIKIFAFKSSQGVSTLTFSLFLFFNIIWFTYGVVHKEKPLIIAFALWFVTNSIIVIGTLIYP